MLRALIALLLIAPSALFAATRLYMKDGTYHVVREYKVDQDRIRYYSTERGDWEEMPVELVDLKRTESEAKQREETAREDLKLTAAEDKAEKDERREVRMIPGDTGVYWVASPQQLKPIPAAESKVVGNKRRSVLKALSPIPIVAGKGTLEIDGEHSKNVIDSDTPEFYIRLSAEQRFGIVRLSARKGNRVVEEFDIIPVSKEIIEKQDEVQIFRRQVADGVYRIWPMKALEPGEYAVVEYTAASMGSINLQTWDFSWPGKR